MTDEELLAKRLAFIETCLRELREEARPDDLRTSVRERRFVEHTLQLAIQAALDVGSHIISDGRLGEPSTNREIFSILARAGWLRAEQVATLSAMVGFRNVLVHGYTDVDLDVVLDVLENHLADLEGFVAAVRSRLARS